MSVCVCVYLRVQPSLLTRLHQISLETIKSLSDDHLTPPQIHSRFPAWRTLLWVRVTGLKPEHQEFQISIISEISFLKHNLPWGRVISRQPPDSTSADLHGGMKQTMLKGLNLFSLKSLDAITARLILLEFIMLNAAALIETPLLFSCLFPVKMFCVATLCQCKFGFFFFDGGGTVWSRCLRGVICSTSRKEKINETRSLARSPPWSRVTTSMERPLLRWKLHR